MIAKKQSVYIAPSCSDTGLSLHYKFISQYCGDMPINTIIETTACLDHICETVLRQAVATTKYINKKPLVDAISSLFKDEHLDIILKSTTCTPWDFHEVLQMIAGECSKPRAQRTKTDFGTDIKRPSSQVLNDVLWNVFKELTSNWQTTQVLNYGMFKDDVKNNMLVAVAAAVDKYNIKHEQGKVLLA